MKHIIWEHFWGSSMFEKLQSSKSQGLVERQRCSGFLGVSFNLFYIARIAFAYLFTKAIKQGSFLRNKAHSTKRSRCFTTFSLHFTRLNVQTRWFQACNKLHFHLGSYSITTVDILNNYYKTELWFGKKRIQNKFPQF